MTSKTSLFNKGVYKSTVKRYMWGSVLYFIMLFLTTVLPLVLNINLKADFRPEISFLYYNSNIFFIFPMLFAMVVPTVVGLLMFRFVHSKKSSVFTHSLPVNRTSMYISTLAGAFTLMITPVILISFIMMIMGATVYAEFITIISCFVWLGVNVLALFLMFSCVCFVAMLTGNSFAMVGLNILLHAIVPVGTIVLNYVARFFLYGMPQTIGQSVERVVSNNYSVWLINLANDIRKIIKGTDEFELNKMILFIICAIIFYILGCVLYKKRNLENAEDVAGFKCLNPIFKYLITAFGTICIFAIFSSLITSHLLLFFIMLAILSAVIYFGAEMLLKKTLKVWTSYKGYAGFLAVFALLISFTAFTHFFGYEKYIPDANEVKEVGVYSHYYGDEPYVTDKDVLEYVLKIHEKLIADDKIYIIEPEEEFYSAFNIKYKLNDGSLKERRYLITEDEYYEFMDGLYEYNSYKLACMMPSADKNEFLYRIFMHANGKESVSIYEPEEMIKLTENIRKDIEVLSYGQIHLKHQTGIGIEIEWEEYPWSTEGYRQYSGYNINSNFKNTLNWLKDMGYSEYTDERVDIPYYIKHEFYDMDSKQINRVVEYLTNSDLNKNLMYRIDEVSVKNNIKKYFEENYIEYNHKKKYFEVIVEHNSNGNTNSYSPFGIIVEDKIKEFVEYILN